MASIILPVAFTTSYGAFEKFPKKIVLRDTYGISQLELIHQRLKERESTLFVSDVETLLPVKDILLDGKVNKRNLCSDAELKKWIGDCASPDPLNTKRLVGDLATKEDPRCRFIFLPADTVTSPLKISLTSLKRIFSYHQVSPNFIEFLDVYGSPSAHDRELRFCGFRSEVHLEENPEPGVAIPGLNRSGRQYQLAYNLKTVASKDPKKGGLIPWKIRQEAVHHQFDVITGVQLWIFGDPHSAMKDRIGEILSDQRNHRDKFSTPSQSFKSSLDVHLATAHWSTGGWRQCILSLEAIIEDLKSQFIFKADKRGARLDTIDLLQVQAHEDKTNETIMVLESNADNMESLCDFYRSLVKDDEFPETERASCARNVKQFCSRVRELIYDTKMQIRRANVLVKTVADQKTILIQQLQAEAALRAEGLSSAMWQQAERTSHDAIAMRIITVITLLYLPPTFVSTLFSTDIVKYQGDDGASPEAFAPLALQRWLQVTLPLMAMTFLAAFGWTQREGGKVKKKAAELEEAFPGVFSDPKVSASW